MDKSDSKPDFKAWPRRQLMEWLSNHDVDLPEKLQEADFYHDLAERAWNREHKPPLARRSSISGNAWECSCGGKNMEAVTRCKVCDKERNAAIEEKGGHQRKSSMGKHPREETSSQETDTGTSTARKKRKTISVPTGDFVDASLLSGPTLTSPPAKGNGTHKETTAMDTSAEDTAALKTPARKRAPSDEETVDMTPTDSVLTPELHNNDFQVGDTKAPPLTSTLASPQVTIRPTRASVPNTEQRKQTFKTLATEAQQEHGRRNQGREAVATTSTTHRRRESKGAGLSSIALDQLESKRGGLGAEPDISHVTNRRRSSTFLDPQADTDVFAQQFTTPSALRSRLSPNTAGTGLRSSPAFTRTTATASPVTQTHPAARGTPTPSSSGSPDTSPLTEQDEPVKHPAAEEPVDTAETDTAARKPSKCRRVTSVLSRILSTALLTALVAVTAFFVYDLYVTHSSTYFCPSVPVTPQTPEEAAQQERCVPCPKHGYCNEFGRLNCLPHYVQQGTSCIPTQEVNSLANKLRSETAIFLGQRRGKEECGQLPPGESAIVETFTLMAHLALLHPEYLLDTKEVDDKLEHAFTSMKQRVSHEINGPIAYTGDKWSATSNGVIYPLGCVTRFWLEAHWQGIAILTSILSLAAWLYAAITSRQRRQQRAQEIYQAVLQHVQATECAVQHLKRDHKASDAVWKLVERLVKEEPRIQEVEMNKDGIPRLHWHWTGPSKIHDNQVDAASTQ